jgi:TP901 family phage tail tape measure protein
MASAIGDLVVRFGGNASKFNRVASGVGRRLGVLRTSAIGLASAMAGAFGVAGGAMAFAGIIRSGEMFNRKMNQSLAIMGDVSDAMKKDMSAAAFDVAKSTRFSAADAAESYYFLASAGLDAKQSIAALPQVAKFAQAGNFDMARATDLATDAQSALGLTVKDSTANLANLTRVTDVLTKANTLANASTEQFSTSLTNKAGPALRALGKDIEEGVAVLAAFADQGIKSEMAGTYLAIVLRDLQTKAIQNAAAFKDAKVSVFEAGEMRNLADIIGDLEGKLKGMSDMAQKATLLELGFTDKSMSSIQALLGTSDKIRDYESKLRQAAGTTEEIAKKQLTPFQKVWAWVSANATKLGTYVMRGVNAAIEWVGQFKEDFIRIGNGIWEYWKAQWNLASEVVGSVLSSLGITTGSFANTVHSALQAVATYFETAAMLVRNAWDVVRLVPIELALAFLNAFPMMEGPLASFAKTFVGTWSGIKAFFGSIIDNMIGGLMEVKNFADAIFAALVAGFQAIASGSGLKSAAKIASDTFINTLAQQADVKAPNAFAAFGDAYKEAAEKFGQKIDSAGGFRKLLEGQQQDILDSIANREAARLSQLAQQDVSKVAVAQPAGIAMPPGAGAEGSRKQKLAGIATRGSTAAYSSIVKNIAQMRGGKKDPQAQVAKNTKDSAKEAKETTKTLKEMLAYFGASEELGIPS